MAKRNGEIDLGLAVLRAIVPPGAVLSHEVIAAACGCSKQYILKLERSAIRKLRRALREHADLRERATWGSV